MKKHSQKNIRLLSTGILLLVAMWSCEPDDLTKPVRIDFGISFTADATPLDYLTFERITIYIEQIGFYGIRQEGNDVLFNTRPGDSFGMQVLTSGQNLSSITYFDIPQGAYQLMRWEIQTASIDDDDVFPDDFIDSDDAGLIIEGTYFNENEEAIHLFIAIDEDEIIMIESENTSGEFPIPILSGNVYDVSMEINPQAIMKGIPRALIEQAETEEEDDVEYIEISEDENEVLYNLVLLQLSKNVKAVVR